MTIKFTLYGTSACHLCEEALAIIHPITETLGAHLDQVDIADDDTLVVRYGLKIPVLATADGEDLCWPFDADEVSKFLLRTKN